jgi:16S rRNA (uracil1498-N3)-methyltransferase
MPRFFKENFKNEPYIEGGDFTHISRSLRMKTGQELIVCDGKGTDFKCVIEGITSDRVLLNVLDETPSESEPDIKVTLYTCLLKGDKFEQVIKHSVELGVSEIVPVVSENCVSRPDEKSLKAKTLRWQKIADEAAGQSGRGILPKLQVTTGIKALAEKIKEYDLFLFFYEAGGTPLGETLWEFAGSKNIAIITGPEGGFSKEEAEMLVSSGAKAISLGKRILRAETAPLAAVTGIMLLTDNLE